MDVHSDFPTARIKPKERMSNMDKPSLTNRPESNGPKEKKRPTSEDVERRKREVESKMNKGLIIEVLANTDNLAAKLRAISKHANALADELEEIDANE